MSTLCVIIMMFCYDLDEQKIKQIPHNVGGSLTDDFQPSAACKFLDLPPGACQPVLAEICPLDRFPGARTQ